jgi:hypothetical protein
MADFDDRDTWETLDGGRAVALGDLWAGVAECVVVAPVSTANDVNDDNGFATVQLWILLRPVAVSHVYRERLTRGHRTRG